MAQIIWTEPAVQDLDRIADYISMSNPAAAVRLVNQVVENIKSLHKYPPPGKRAEELDESVYRELVIPPCRVFYRVDDNTIYIVHIMRSEQLLRIELLKTR